jgi:hypothetical protein
MATFTPLSDPEHPYLTAPIDGILPKEVSGFVAEQQAGDTHAAALLLKDGRHVAIICLPNSVVLVSPVLFRAMGIENDRLSGGERTLWSSQSSKTIPALEKQPPLDLPGNWLNISDRLGLISSGTSFNYTPAGGYTQKAVAADRVVLKDAVVWQIVPEVDHLATQTIAQTFRFDSQSDVVTATVKDGRDGSIYRIHCDLTNHEGAGIEVNRE